MSETAQQQKVLEQEVEKLTPRLRDELASSWKNFSTGEDNFERLKKRFDATAQEWYQSDDFGKITNPWHMELARMIGEKFVYTCAENGIALAQSFPGIFRKGGSIEIEGPKDDARRFTIDAYVKGIAVGTFVMDWPHIENAFGFNESPQLSFQAKSKQLPMLNSHLILKGREI